MRVRFKHGWGRAYAMLTPGNVYRVLGIESDALRIVDDTGEPILFAHQAFEDVDPIEPADWISERGEDGERYAYPPELRRPLFSFERWHDGDPAARAQLGRHLRELCRREAGEPANTYLRVRWLHTHAEDPTLLYSELDEARWEVRKVEIYADGRVTYATGNGRSGTTRLGDAAVPPLAELAAMPEFEPVEITRAEFDAVWDDALARD